MLATIHEVPDGEEGNLHKFLNCWCKPEHKREGDTVRTIHHAAVLIGHA